MTMSTVNINRRVAKGLKLVWFFSEVNSINSHN